MRLFNWMRRLIQPKPTPFHIPGPDLMRINPHASRKLRDILAHAIIRQQARNCPYTDIAQHLRVEARKHHGQTRKFLNQIADLGPERAQHWINHFIDWMNAKQDAPDTDPTTNTTQP